MAVVIMASDREDKYKKQSMLDKLFKNKSLQNAMLKQFKSVIKGQDIKHIVINLDEEGNLQEPTLYKDEIVVLKKPEYDKMINELTSNL